ncbi:hypothetical protein FBU30_000788 [Linnemannia zychae]|nr:hypothetical protein FBU30_000788 [Linnemannia zychae]
MPLSVSIPVSSGGNSNATGNTSSSGLMLSSPTSANPANLFTSSAATSSSGSTSSMPFYNAPQPTSSTSSSLPTVTIIKEDPTLAESQKLNTATMMASFQHQSSRSNGQHHPNQQQQTYSPIATGAGSGPSSSIHHHPNSPKRQRTDSGHQALVLAQLSPASIGSNSGIALADFTSGPFSSPTGTSTNNTVAAVAVVTNATASMMAAPHPSTAAIATSSSSSPLAAQSKQANSDTVSGRTMTTGVVAARSRLDKAKESRTAKVAKTASTVVTPIVATSVGSVSTGTRATSRRTASMNRVNPSIINPVAPINVTTPMFGNSSSSSISRTFNQHQQQTLIQPMVVMDPHLAAVSTAPVTITPIVAPTGNVTHPRRAAQNRAAQRTFRNRRKAYIKDMEQRVLELTETRRRLEEVQNENREMWRRYRVLEGLVMQHGLTLPNFPVLTPTCLSNTNTLEGSNNGAKSGTTRHSGSEIEDENKSLSSSLRQPQPWAQQQQQRGDPEANEREKMEDEHANDPL